MSTRLKLSKICEHCGKSYHPYYKEQKYCSTECYNPHRGESRKNRIVNTCEVCGKKYESINARADTSRYCSKECWAHRSPPKEKTCPICKKKFETYSEDQITCSRECAGKRRSKIYVGENAPAWKGGNSAKTKRGELKGELAKWRNRVFQRDDYTCQKCGKTSCDFHAHHIKPLSKYPDLALDTSNGVTLCVKCHEDVHGRKLSSPSKFPKHCADCGAKTTGRSKRCRSCSIKLMWKKRRTRKRNEDESIT